MRIHFLLAGRCTNITGRFGAHSGNLTRLAQPLGLSIYTSRRKTRAAPLKTRAGRPASPPRQAGPLRCLGPLGLDFRHVAVIRYRVQSCTTPKVPNIIQSKCIRFFSLRMGLTGELSEDQRFNPNGRTGGSYPRECRVFPFRLRGRRTVNNPPPWRHA